MQRVLSVGEIFYSPVKNSCIYTVKLSQEKIDLRTEQELNKISLSIIDYLNGKVLFSVSKDLFNVD